MAKITIPKPVPPLPYLFNYTIDPPSCLPSDVDVSTYEDITEEGDYWRSYRDPATGYIHDGDYYFDQAIAYGKFLASEY